MKGQFLKKALAGCLALMIVSGSVPVNPVTDLFGCTAVTASAESVASGECGKDLMWSLSDEGVLTITGTGAMQNYTSTNKAPWYDRRSKITSVSLCDGVTSIGNRAFHGCESLTSVTIPDSVTRIGINAFFGCESLTSVTIPDSVTSIRGSAFQGCTSLTSVTIPEGVTSIGSNAFYGCESLTSVTIPDNITSIGSSAFSNCTSLKSINIPNDYLHMDNTTFQGCNSLTDLFFYGTKAVWYDGYTLLKIPENCKVHYEFTHIPAKEPTYEEDGNIAYYTDSENNVYISENGGFTESSLEAVTIPGLTTTSVVINNIDINGIKTPTTVAAETFTANDYTVPAAPYLDGYDFHGWTVNDTLYQTADDVMTAVAALVAEKPETAITVKVVYEKKDEKFTVEVVNGTLKNGKTSGSYQASEQLYVTADTAPEGKKFDHWEKDGVTVGYDKTYAFRMPSANTTLTAVYSDLAVEVEAVGTAYIESVKKPAANKLSFVSILSVPDGCQMLKAGIVVQKTEILNGEELTTANAKATRYSDTSNNHYSSFKYTWTLTTSNATAEWTVRSYLEYKDKNGEIKTIYGDAVSKSLNTV